MSIKHLEMLENQLIQRGWSVSNAYSDQLYYVTNDFTVYWEITRGINKEAITLIFPIHGDFGRRSTNLNDIFYCEESRNSKILYFKKVKSKEWTENLKEWVSSLMP
ncbi:hypothetical protein LSPCS325_42150 [Lysinibacillus sp. CTST325]